MLIEAQSAAAAQTSSTRRSAPRLAMLDGLRFVAALAVLSYHFTGLRTQFWGVPTNEAFPRAHVVGTYGYLGVELFFFISGFVILMTAWGRPLSAFAASRVARLFPAYWAGVALTGGLLLATGSALKEIQLDDIFVNLTMVQMPMQMDNVDGVYWTLWAELRFYIAMAVFAAIGITRNKVIVFALAWPMVGAVASAADQAFLREALLADWSPFFAVGMLLYLVHREGWSPFLAGLIGFDLLLALSRVGSYSHVIVKRTGTPADPLVVWLVVLVAFALVAGATTTRLRDIRWGWATWLGALTYPLYLVHEYVGFFLISHLHGTMDNVLVLGVTVVGVLALAWAIHRFIEVPLAPRIRANVRNGLDAGARAGMTPPGPGAQSAT